MKWMKMTSSAMKNGREVGQEATAIKADEVSIKAEEDINREWTES